MSPRAYPVMLMPKCFPRPRGDEPTNDLIGVAADLFSPPARG